MESRVSTHGVATARAQATARRVHAVEPAEAEATPYVGLVTRVIAFALDAAIINVVAVVVAAVVALVLSILPESPPKGGGAAVAVGGIAFALWVVGYFVAFWTTTGQTPGNRVLQIRVRRADATPLRVRHAIVRLFGIVISAPLMIGFLPILVNERRRGLQDWLAGTVVIASPREDGGRP